jgi:hypothetical protein
MTLVVARSLSFPNRWMLESFAQLATAAKSLESFEKAFQPKHSKMHNDIAPRQPQQATLPTEGGAVLFWVSNGTT